MPSPHEHPVIVVIIAGAMGAIAGFLVDSAGLVVIALLQTDEATGPDTVFGAAVSTVQSYLLLVSGGVALLVASAAWRRLRPRDLTELDAEPEGARAEERSEH